MLTQGQILPQRRIAFLFGNSEHVNASRLNNPVNTWPPS